MDDLPSRSPSIEELDKNLDVSHREVADPETEALTQTLGAGSSPKAVGKDAALTVLGESAQPIIITAKQDHAVLRKIDIWIMPVIFMVYFLQQLDKCVSNILSRVILADADQLRSSLSYTSVFGIQEDARRFRSTKVILTYCTRTCQLTMIFRSSREAV